MEAGGLFICGTERHESRRIDNQLRGRAGRQGDPGESRFFLSAEDDLVRLFAGDRIYKILDRLGTLDDEGNEEPIEAGMLTKQIEKAQKKVEEQNFLIRKRVLEYDDVMNEQRRVVYEYRDEVLEGKDMGEHRPRGAQRASSAAWSTSTRPRDFVEDWDLDGPVHRAARHLPAPSSSRRSARSATATARSSSRRCSEEAQELYERREEELGEELMRALERYLLLQIIDQQLARAPLRHGLPARGHPPARVRPDRPARRLQERGVRRSSPT